MINRRPAANNHGFGYRENFQGLAKDHWPILGRPHFEVYAYGQCYRVQRSVSKILVSDHASDRLKGDAYGERCEKLNMVWFTMIAAGCPQHEKKNIYGGENKMKIQMLVIMSVLMVAGSSAMALQKEIFGLQGVGGGYNIYRYDVMANSFYNCGAIIGGNFATNLAMDNNRRLYYMFPFDYSHVLYQADLDSGNNLINQQVHDTFAPGMNIIDGFTIGPDPEPLYDRLWA